MSKLNQAQEQTMEEILASIRRMISDDEVRSTLPRPVPEPIKAPANVSRLFAETAVKAAPSAPPAEPLLQFVAETPSADNVVEMTIDQAIEDAVAEAEYAPDDEDQPASVEVPRRESRKCRGVLSTRRERGWRRPRRAGRTRH